MLCIVQISVTKGSAFATASNCLPANFFGVCLYKSINYLLNNLTGKWESYRECHIGGDFLLIYKLGGPKSMVR